MRYLNNLTLLFTLSLSPKETESKRFQGISLAGHLILLLVLRNLSPYSLWYNSGYIEISADTKESIEPRCLTSNSIAE